MKKKNIILLCIAIIIVIICILAVFIGYGSKNKSDSDDEEVESTGYEESDDDENDSDDESVDDETTEESAESLEENSSDETESDADMETDVVMDTDEPEETQASSETVEEETTKEVETEISTTEPSKQENQKPLDRFSYEYMLIDGKTLYNEYNEKIAELYASINAERRAAGKSELLFDKDISYVACAMASQTAYKASVDGGGEVLYYDMMKSMGIKFTKAVDNYAAGQETAKDVVSGSYGSWKTSQKHYDNVLSTDYTRVGVGVDYSESLGYVWVAIFSN